MTDFNKLADALDITANWMGDGFAATLKDIANIRETQAASRSCSSSLAQTMFCGFLYMR